MVTLTKAITFPHLSTVKRKGRLMGILWKIYKGTGKFNPTTTATIGFARGKGPEILNKIRTELQRASK